MTIFSDNVTTTDSANTQQQQPIPKTDNVANHAMDQYTNTSKRQWSPQRTSTPIAESTSPSTSLQCESPSAKSNTRVESPFSSQQPNPLLPKPLSPIKMENSNTKQVESQKQPEEVLSRQQREQIHQQEVLDQIRRQNRWQQPPQHIQQQQQQQQREIVSVSFLELTHF